MAREIRKETETTMRHARRIETKIGKKEEETSSELARENKRVYPLHSNNCHLLSPFICTNRSAMTLFPSETSFSEKTPIKKIYGRSW